MKRALIALGLSLALVSTALARDPLRDVYGVLSITPASGFTDTSSNYREAVARSGTQRDTGIRSLMFLTTQNGMRTCKFREFRYEEWEEGYRLSEQDIAESTDDAFTSMGAPLFEPAPNNRSRIASEAVSLGVYGGWRVVTDHWREVDGHPADNRLMRHQTILLRFPDNSTANGAPIHYIVSECNVRARRDQVDDAFGRIAAMLETLQIHRASL